MNKLKKAISLLSLFFVLPLAACQQTDQQKQTGSNLKPSRIAMATKQGTAVSGGCLRLALETDTPFKGIFANELATTETDQEASSPGNEALFDTDNDYAINNRGPAKLHLDQATKTARIVIKPNVRWSDGTYVRAQDIAYSYQVLANPAAKSPHYTSSLNNIVGLKQYHQGRTANISGIQLPAGPHGRVVLIHFRQMHPGMLRAGNGYLWQFALPYHYLHRIPMAQLVNPPRVRKHPLFFGPFRLLHLTAGERTVWAPNKYYWQGRPKLKRIVCQVLNPSSAAIALRNKQFDLLKVVNAQWKDVQQVPGYRFIGKIPLSYSYLAFKVGKWNAAKGENVMNSHAKMNNQSVRQAMIYALNISQSQRKYSEGLSFAIPTLILKQFGPYFDSSLPGYRQNIVKAKQLLDRAGYHYRAAIGLCLIVGA